jgi:hypothetical protein
VGRMSFVLPSAKAAALAEEEASICVSVVCALL